MNNFFDIGDVDNVQKLVQQAIALKKDPLKYADLGKGKRLGLAFLNPSLRTRLSSEIAAKNLGMEVTTLNLGADSWAIEYEDNVVMDRDKVEHIRDAAGVMGTYFDVLGIRAFAGLKEREVDDQEQIFAKFKEISGIPLLNLESATLHPLQSLADLISMEEHRQKERPKVVLSWAPHIKPIPQAVANSFAQWTLGSGMDLTITHPEGMELNEKFTKGAKIEYDQQKALENADFVYVKNWSSYKDYGAVYSDGRDWMLTPDHFQHNANARIMHCLPVRRNLELSGALIDSSRSLVQKQAENRIYAAQVVLKNILENLS